MESLVVTLARLEFQQLARVVRLMTANAPEGGLETFCTQTAAIQIKITFHLQGHAAGLHCQQNVPQRRQRICTSSKPGLNRSKQSIQESSAGVFDQDNRIFHLGKPIALLMAKALPHMSKGYIHLPQCWLTIGNEQRSHPTRADQHGVQRIIPVTASSPRVYR